MILLDRVSPGSTGNLTCGNATECQISTTWARRALPRRRPRNSGIDSNHCLSFAWRVQTKGTFQEARRAKRPRAVLFHLQSGRNLGGHGAQPSLNLNRAELSSELLRSHVRLHFPGPSGSSHPTLRLSWPCASALPLWTGPILHPCLVALGVHRGLRKPAARGLRARRRKLGNGLDAAM